MQWRHHVIVRVAVVVEAMRLCLRNFWRNIQECLLQNARPTLDTLCVAIFRGRVGGVARTRHVNIFGVLAGWLAGLLLHLRNVNEEREVLYT